MLIVPRKRIWTQQPQQAVQIDRYAAKGVTALFGFNGGALYDFATERPVDGTTLYSTPIKSVITPNGVGIGDPAYGAGYSYGSVGMGYFPLIFWVTFCIKDGSITNADGILLCSTHRGAGIVGYGNENTCLFWKNTAGERVVGAILSFPGQTIEFSGVSDGLHTVALSMSRNNIPVIYLDGDPVAFGSALTGNYYVSTALSTTSFEPKTLYSSGIGVVLHRGVWSTGIENSPQDNGFAQRITANPWQIFRAPDSLIFVPTGAVAGSGDSLTASSIIASPATVGSPSLSQQHVLSASSIASAPAVVASPVITQRNALSASAVSASPAVVGSASITQRHALTATAISAAPAVVGSPTLTEIVAGVLSALPIVAAPAVVGAPAITQRHVLSAGAISAGPATFGTPTLAQQHALIAQGVTAGAAVVGAPVLSKGGAVIFTNAPNGGGYSRAGENYTRPPQTNTVRH